MPVVTGLYTAAAATIAAGLPPLRLDLPWGDLPLGCWSWGAVIALVDFAEVASSSRRYASEDRRAWDANREFVGQGLANVAAEAFHGYPAEARSRARRLTN